MMNLVRYLLNYTAFCTYYIFYIFVELGTILKTDLNDIIYLFGVLLTTFSIYLSVIIEQFLNVDK